MSKSLKRQQEIESSVDIVGLDEFRMYAIPKGMAIKESTYGVRKIVHNGKSSYREVVEATLIGPDNKPVRGGSSISLVSVARRLSLSMKSENMR